MVSLKSKNPFGGNIELFSVKTWVGIGAAAVIMGIFAVMVGGVKTQAEKIGNPIEMLQERLAGLGA